MVLAHPSFAQRLYHLSFRMSCLNQDPYTSFADRIVMHLRSRFQYWLHSSTEPLLFSKSLEQLLHCQSQPLAILFRQVWGVVKERKSFCLPNQGSEVMSGAFIRLYSKQYA